MPDPQYLGFVTPRLSDTAADLTQDYTEQSGSFVKLQFDEGKVDFVAAHNLLADTREACDISGRSVKVETAAEIRCTTVVTGPRRAIIGERGGQIDMACPAGGHAFHGGA